MTTLRIINIIIWLVVVVYCLPGAWAAASSRATRRGDPMRLACLATGFVMMGFNLRWLLAPENQTLWQALYVLAAADGLYVLSLARAYGRGARV